MRFGELAFAETLSKGLREMVDSGRIPHAILFHEDDGGGAMALSLSFLQYLYCHSHKDGDSCGECAACNKVSKLIHPDIRFVFPTVNTSDSSSKRATSQDYMKQWRELVTGNPYFLENEFNQAVEAGNKQPLIALGEAHGILETLSLSAVEDGYRAVVVYLPEKMNESAANTLLKMVEEPPESTLFLMITHAPEKVLRTISSRCLRLRVPPMDARAFYAAHPSGGAETARLADMFREMMLSALSRDLLSTQEAAEEVAALPSREARKAFLKVASEDLGTIFHLQQGIAQLEEVPEADREFFSKAASSCKKTFPRRALQRIDRAVMLLERNVNQKIIFCNLADFIYMSV